MCGLAGFLRTASTPGRDSHRLWLEQMGEAILHRGPDAGGIHLDDDVGLVHRRLSIIDLSDSGNQPMHSGCGRFIIVFNGEIYNYRSLRQQLKGQGVEFKTESDTEVLLALYVRKQERCLDDLNGMFAFAVWDTWHKELFLARDRLGKKPLYYFAAGGCAAFASEIKSLLVLPFIPRTIRSDAVKDFFAYQYVPDPKSIFANIYKLPPGHCLKTNGRHHEIKKYWDVSFSPVSHRSEEQIQAELYDLIADATRLRMVSDVPLGAFLSGGVDSSAIVGLMARQSDAAVTTCSIGFDSKEFDEVTFARQVAKQFKTDHHEFTVRDSVSDRLVAIANFFDEPFADPSFVPTYFVSELARRRVTVALAGDGGDENFAGYSKYHIDDVENQLRKLFPGALRRSVFPSMARLAGSIPHSMGRKAQSLLGTLAEEPDTAFFNTNSFFRQSVWDRLVKKAFASETQDYDPADITRYYYHQAEADDHLSRILYTDIKTYLPGDILVKVDRMSMANSLETRAPLLDYRVVEYAAGIPSALKLKGREKKHVLKKTFSGLLSDEVLYRKKMGFSVPLAQWLRHEIQAIADQIFQKNEGGLAQCFEMSEVRRLWSAHLSGDNRFTQELWSLLMFELWWQAYIEPEEGYLL